MFVVLVIILYALLGGWIISDAIRDFQHKRYYFCALEATISMVTLGAMIYFVLELL